jgi:glycyl-tRNA synthetase alpha chain
MEITQFTYFQQVGGLELEMIPAELTYGLERLAMYVQKVDSVFDIQWSENVKYGDVHKPTEREFSYYNFEYADTNLMYNLFNSFEKECNNILEKNLVFPAYDYVLKCSHAFNMLDARGAISVSERMKYILRVRTLAKKVAEKYYELYCN